MNVPRELGVGRCNTVMKSHVFNIIDNTNFITTGRHRPFIKSYIAFFPETLKPFSKSLQINVRPLAWKYQLEITVKALMDQ